MGNSHTALPRPAPFNFLNGTGMGIGFAKRGGVGMEATRPEPAPLPFLLRAMWSISENFCKLMIYSRIIRDHQEFQKVLMVPINM